MSESTRDLDLAVQAKRMVRLRTPLVAIVALNCLIVVAIPLTQSTQSQASVDSDRMLAASSEQPSSEHSNASQSSSKQPSSTHSPAPDQPLPSAGSDPHGTTTGLGGSNPESILDLVDVDDPLLDNPDDQSPEDAEVGPDEVGPLHIQFDVVDDAPSQAADHEALVDQFRIAEQLFTELGIGPAADPWVNIEDQDDRLDPPEVELPDNATVTQRIERRIDQVDQLIHNLRSAKKLNLASILEWRARHRRAESLRYRTTSVPERMAIMLARVIASLAKNVETPPTAPDLVVINRLGNGGTIHFVVDGKVESLAPGEELELDFGPARLIQFHRGGQFGVAQINVDGGEYHFVVTDTGWDLIEHDSF